MKAKFTKEEQEDIEVNGNNAMRGEDNYDEMSDEITNN